MIMSLVIFLRQRISGDRKKGESRKSGRDQKVGKQKWKLFESERNFALARGEAKKMKPYWRRRRSKKMINGLCIILIIFCYQYDSETGDSRTTPVML